MLSQHLNAEVHTYMYVGNILIMVLVGEYYKVYMYVQVEIWIT